MLIDNKPLDINKVLADAHPRGVIHCGAFMGEELSLYQANGVKHRCWIEASTESFKLLKSNIPEEDVALNFAVWNEDGIHEFFVMSNGASSSLLDPKAGHCAKYTDIKVTSKVNVVTRKLDTLVDTGFINIKKYDLLYMDLQGAEYYALQGFEKYINKIDYILLEVNYEPLYEGTVLMYDLNKYLNTLGFTRQIASIHRSVGWGDAYYKRTNDGIY
jgi:FkbM family methyltransferase